MKSSVHSLIAAALFGAVALPIFAQAPAAPAAAARGGRGGGAAAAAPVGTLAQRIAVGQMNDAVMDLTAKVTAAQAALNTAAFALPRNQSLITKRAQELAAADQNLANARATAFQKLQSSQNKLSASELSLVTGGGRGGGNAGMIPWEDSTGFVSIYDGTLNGWDGETNVWSIDDGAIHADTVKTPGQHHLVYVGRAGWPDKVMKDFDFKVDVKLSATGANGGIQYRSRLLNAAHSPNGEARGAYDPASISDPFGKPLPANVHTVEQAQAAIPGLSGNPWQVSGYQFDLYSAHTGTGQLYEGQGRGIVTNTGYIGQLLPGGVYARLGSILPDAENPAMKFGKVGDWNEMEVIARGNVLMHLMNGHVLQITTDDDPYRRAAQGLMSIQLEGSGQIWYKNMRLKELDPMPQVAAKK